MNFYPDLFNLYKQLCPKSKVLEFRICMLFLLLIKDLSDRKSSCGLKSILNDSGSRGIDKKLIDQKLMVVKKYQDQDQDLDDFFYRFGSVSPKN